jgi:hypothetical protein
MDDKDFRPRSALSQSRHRPILSPDQQQQQQEATTNAQLEGEKKKIPPPRPRRELRFHSPPPVLPARSPLRSPGPALPPREPLRVAEIWDPGVGHYVKRLADGRFGGVVDDGTPGGRRFGGGYFGRPNAHRTPGVRIPSLRPGMEVASRDGSTAATGSQTQGIVRSRSVNENRINNTNPLRRAPTPRLLTLANIDRPLSDPTASGPGRELNHRRVHEQVNNLRQAYIHNLHVNEFETELRADDEVSHTNARPATPIYELSISPPSPPQPPRPSTPLHRSISNPSASSSALQASARNFSLPSYGSPSANEQQLGQQLFPLENRSMSGPLPLQQEQQVQQRHFPLESRIMSGPLPLPSTNSRWNLHVDNDAPTVATPMTPVQDTPRRPLRRVRSKSVSLGRIAEASDAPKTQAKKLGWWDEMEEEAVEEARMGGGHGKEREEEEQGAGSASGFEAKAGKVVQLATTATTKPKRKVWKEVDVVEEELVEESKEEEEEEACGRCKSIRRALARNPLCCVDRPKMQRLCFKCWSEALAEGLKTEERDKWLCCLVCGRELLSGDTKRLASRGTILR